MSLPCSLPTSRPGPSYPLQALPSPSVVVATQQCRRCAHAPGQEALPNTVYGALPAQCRQCSSVRMAAVPYADSSLSFVAWHSVWHLCSKQLYPSSSARTVRPKSSSRRPFPPAFSTVANSAFILSSAVALLKRAVPPSPIPPSSSKCSSPQQ